MKKTIETSFKRIETKYIVAKDDVKDLIKEGYSRCSCETTPP